MADMEMPQKNGRRKKQNLRVDLTPMVDLGFLLIAFFMFTTSLAKPKSMTLNVPDNTDISEPTAFPMESTITLIPVGAHKVDYYLGELQEKQIPVGYPINDIRRVLQEGQKQAMALPATFSKDAHRLHVLIKPTDKCTYADVVALLDEMNILQVPIYTLADLAVYDQEYINRH